MQSREQHRLKNTPEYNSWCAMKQRCNYPKNKRYNRYGGRGIKVCDRWNSSFLAFLEDMGTKPTQNHSIDRIDNDGDYEPNNCRWATISEQTRNRSDVKIIEYRGEFNTMRGWAKILGMNYTTLKQRLSIYNWSVERAFNDRIREWSPYKSKRKD